MPYSRRRKSLPPTGPMRQVFIGEEHRVVDESELDPLRQYSLEDAGDEIGLQSSRRLPSFEVIVGREALDALEQTPPASPEDD